MMKRLLIALNILISVSGFCNGDIIEQALSAVVTVAVEKNQPIGKVILGFRGGIAEETYAQSLKLSNALGTGSGFVVEKNGKKYVVTNAHVVESAGDEAGSLFVYSYQRRKYEVRVLGGDSFYDIALLEFVDDPGAEFTSLEFLDRLPRIADRVFAIGNPLGEYPYTVTDGIVSALNRVRGGLTGKYGYIQSTATTIWGNSGGPLINEQGKVVGINSQIGFATGPDGNAYLQQQLNFALEPVLSNEIVEAILTKGKYERAYLGVEIAQSFAIERNWNGHYIGNHIDEWPIIKRVLPSSPVASKLKPFVDWEIRQINGLDVFNVEEVLGELEKMRPGKDVTMRLHKNGKLETVSLKTSALGKLELEHLAEHVITQHLNISVDKNSPIVKITIPAESPLNKNYYWSLESSPKSKQEAQFYYIIGGGKNSSLQNDIWRITTLADLGALLRIYGLYGGIEYFVTHNTQDLESISKLTQNFSGKENIFQSTLWY